MVGGLLVVPPPLPEVRTVMLNAGRDADSTPSDTVMRTPLYVPTWDDVGVPLSRPVLVLNVAHEGLF